MKTAIYLDEADTQLVLTPENEWEKNILHMTHEAYPESFWGEFYGCQGGWIRQSTYETKNSLILRLKQAAKLPDNLKGIL